VDVGRERPVYEALQVSGIGRHQLLALDDPHQLGSPLVHNSRRHQPDPRVSMRTVVQSKESLAEYTSILKAPEAFRGLPALLQHFQLGLGEQVIINRIGPTVCFGDPQVSK